MNYFRKKNPWNFQLKAINNIINDFKKDKHGRFLLVLPTGGGKTLTAIRVIDKMLKEGMITSTDQVLWVVHTLSLSSNAKKSLNSEENFMKFSFHGDLKKIIDVRMKSDAVKQLEKGVKYKYIIIDEAHHSSAGSYINFFEYPVGILGLTATPRRMDQKELPFSRISFSITFKELVKLGVVLSPKFLPELNTKIGNHENSAAT